MKNICQDKGDNKNIFLQPVNTFSMDINMAIALDEPNIKLMIVISMLSIYS